MVDINPKGKHDNEKTMEKQLYEKPENRDMMSDINPEGEYDENQTAKKPEKKEDVVANTNSEDKYDEEEVAEKQLVATGDAPRLRKEDSIAKEWKMKAEISLVQDNGIDDAKKVIETNEEDVVRQDFNHLSPKAENKELDQVAKKSFGAKGKDDDTEEEAEAKVGTSAEQEKCLADNTDNAERLGTVEGDATGEHDQGQVNIFRHYDHLMLYRHCGGCCRYDNVEKRAIDKSDEEDVKTMLIRKKIRKMGRKVMRMIHKHWEDAEEEGSRDADNKSMREEETEIPEDKAEEKVNDDDPGEDDRKHFIKKDGSKDDSEDTADEDVMKQEEVPKNQETIKKELAAAVNTTNATETKAEIQDRGLEGTVKMHKLLEDAEEEGSPGADIKSVSEVEMERAEDEAEGEVDDDYLRENDRQHFIKGDALKDNSEVATDEEVVKQDKTPNNQEINKKEPDSAVVITNATEMKTENQEGVRDDTVEVDRDETNEAPFNRENTPEVRTEAKRKLNNRQSKNWRLRELMRMMMMRMLLMLQVDVVMARDSLGQGQVEQCLESLGCRLINAEYDLNRRKTTGAIMLRNNEVNVLRERVNMGAREYRFDRDTVGHDDDDD
jgi:hypothetical protein